jgi:hypothetical protein
MVSNKILNEIAEERNYQIERWGKDADLKINTPMDFVGYMSHHSTRWFTGGFRPYRREELENFRKEMVKVGALALAAIEYADGILDGTNNRTDVLFDREGEND